MNPRAPDEERRVESHKRTSSRRSPSPAAHMGNSGTTNVAEELSNDNNSNLQSSHQVIGDDAFRLRATRKAIGVRKDKSAPAAGVLEHLLWKRVLETRLDLFQDCILLNENPSSRQVALLDIDADINKHAQAVEAFQTIRGFHESKAQIDIGGDFSLLQFAAYQATYLDYEQEQSLNNPNATKDTFSPCLDTIDSQIAEARRSLVSDPKWLQSGRRNTFSRPIYAQVERLRMGAFGGLSLLVPMMIMVLKPTKLAALVTTNVCVFVVGLTLALAVDESVGTKDVFAGVVAYAAVLVVFVGTSQAGNTGENDDIVGGIAGGILGGTILLTGLWFGFFYVLFKRREKVKRKNDEIFSQEH